jgi:5-oxoprolinase (ATP-hydrolysing)
VTASGLWEAWVDTGGTFTDCVAVSPEGEIRRAKVLSSGALRGRVEGVQGDMLYVEADWSVPSRFIVGMKVRFPALESEGTVALRVEGYDAPGGVIRLDGVLKTTVAAGEVFEVHGDEEAPNLAARVATGTAFGRPLPPMRMRLGTTRGTNALLERKGATVALFVTRGFRDVLAIGTQQRPDLFALRIDKPPPLYGAVIEVDERLSADGSVLRPLKLRGLDTEIDRLLAEGVRSAAVALAHSWVNPIHEQRLAERLGRKGFEHVSCSADLSPTIRFLPRAETAVVNAYLAPVLGEYLGRVAGSLPPGVGPDSGSGSAPGLSVMTSAGWLIPASEFRPKDSLLSGPAGGVIGAAFAASRSGFARVIAFDMGGTSTDVSRLDAGRDEHEYVFEHGIGSARVAAPALAIETVAAGGGSVCRFDGDALRVGPRSAGADPGPACYGAGGPLTVTDVNLLLGRLDPARFGIPVAAEPARARLAEVMQEVKARRGGAPSEEDILEGFLAVACERMSGAIGRVSVQRGYDPADHALLAFGGAGAQHGCELADRLGIRTVLVPADAGLLSAWGLGHAARERMAERQLLRPLDEMGPGFEALVAELEHEALEALERDGVADRQVRRRLVHLRFHGQEAGVAVEYAAGTGLEAAFLARYRALHGDVPEGREIEVESVRVLASSRPVPAIRADESAGVHEVDPIGTRRAWFGRWVDARMYERASLRAGARLDGPALVLEAHSATVVEPGWCCRVDGAGTLVLEKAETVGVARIPPAARVELATGRLASIAGEMGHMLRRTALSVNVKERLDYSCAVLDAAGNLVVNAPHIPVHLGALGECVRSLRDRIDMGPGDVAATNHPAVGGSHLPDVTVVTPVFSADGMILAYVASRAHHAEIGGTRPGSMPTDARMLEEEGVVIGPMHLIRGGLGRWDEVERVLTGARWPSRAPADNLADLRAQVAANHRGVESLREFVSRHGETGLIEAMQALTERAERRTRAALDRVRGGAERWEATAEELLDDGTPLRVRVELTHGGAVIDFAGSGVVHPGNLNATPAIVRSAVMYVVRLLADEPMPLNEGLLRAVDIRIPPGILRPPFDPDPARCPAVAGGNTETSQRVVDVLLKAVRLAACSQGTMNNVVFGNDRFGFYETVCGGAGAGPGFDGADATHTHMTNTRITDVEIMERRCPVRVERFEIRRGSGGEGKWRGGDGVMRELVFLEPCSLSVIGQHRRGGPYGVEGGSPGAPGRQRVVRADGRILDLPPVGQCEVGPGDRLVLETPGGGGWGDPGQRSGAS